MHRAHSSDSKASSCARLTAVCLLATLVLSDRPGSCACLPQRGRSRGSQGGCARLTAVCLLAALVLSDRPGSSACWPQRGRSRGSQEGAALASLQFACLLLGSCRTDRAAALACRSGWTAALASQQFACLLLGSCRTDRAAAPACRSGWTAALPVLFWNDHIQRKIASPLVVLFREQVLHDGPC